MPSSETLEKEKMVLERYQVWKPHLVSKKIENDNPKIDLDFRSCMTCRGCTGCTGCFGNSYAETMCLSCTGPGCKGCSGPGCRGCGSCRA